MDFNIKIKSDKTRVKQSRRDFRKCNCKENRKSLAHIDGNDKMKNQTATECWNILIGELDSAIDGYVPMKKQGNRSKKNHLSKKAFRMIGYKQDMWRVYKHTGKDQDYEVYKEALNAATNEVRKHKRNFEHKRAQNKKSDSKSFYAYVRSTVSRMFEISWTTGGQCWEYNNTGIFTGRGIKYALQFSVHERRY